MGALSICEMIFSPRKEMAELQQDGWPGSQSAPAAGHRPVALELCLLIIHPSLLSALTSRPSALMSSGTSVQRGTKDSRVFFQKDSILNVMTPSDSDSPLWQFFLTASELQVEKRFKWSLLLSCSFEPPSTFQALHRHQSRQEEDL